MYCQNEFVQILHIAHHIEVACQAAESLAQQEQTTYVDA